MNILDSINDVVLNPVGLTTLEQTFNLVENQLSLFANATDFQENIASIFDIKNNSTQINLLQEAWKNGDFSIIPTIEIVSDGTLNGAIGAFSIQTTRIYLSESLSNSANSSLIFQVILEEIGHKIDSELNEVDTAGDEGQLFSAVVRGQTLSATELNGIKQENDQTVVMIGGQSVAIEMSTNIIYVNANAASNGNGSSWGNAYKYLTDAIASSQSGDQIWVAKGVYYADEGTGRIDNNTSQSFGLKNGVAIYGGFAGTETSLNQRNWQTNQSILSGDIDKNDTNTDGNNIAEQVSDIQGSNSLQVVVNDSINSTAILDGFVITGGHYDPNNLTWGGGMTNENSSPTINNVTFSANSSYQGGGMFNSNSSPRISNVIFFGNSAAQNGGGMFNGNSSPSISNVTFSGNSAPQGAAMVNNWYSSPTISNTIIWANTTNAGPQVWTINYSTPNISYSLIENSFSGGSWDSSLGTNGGNNLDSNPLFVDAANGNLRLQVGSPAINAGNNNALPLDTADLDKDGNTTEPIPLDLAVNLRIQNGTVDLGAYERSQYFGTTGIVQFGSSTTEVGTKITSDSSGNLYVTGWTAGTLQGTSIGLNDAYIAKYDTNGNQVWVKQFGTSNLDGANGMTTDSSGNIYVTGGTLGSMTGYTSQGNTDVFITKYDANGNQLWVKQFGTSFVDNGYGIITDNSGNFYVTGATTGSLPGYTNQGENDAFIAKYDANGNQVWLRQFGTSGSDLDYGINIDNNGNLYVTGATTGSMPGNISQGYWDPFVAKYDTNGNQIWVKQFGSLAPRYWYDDGATEISTDSSGNVYICGGVQGTLPGNTHQGNQDAFIAKYDTNGNQVWAKQFGTSSQDWATGITTDSNGNIYLTGGTQGSLGSNSSQGGFDAFIAKYDSSGNQIWVKQFGSSADDTPNAIAIDSNGNLHITGTTTGSMPGNTNQGMDDVFIATFDSNGNLVTNYQTPQHTYYLTNAAIWADAQAQAVAMGGNLVTINDAAENQFLVNAFGSYSYLWTGFNDIATEGNWQWVNGEPVTYTNWNTGEPNNGAGGEQQDQGAIYTDGTWDDGWGYSLSYRGIVEVINGTSTISFEQTNITETEGNKQVTFTVTLNGVSPTKTFTVDYSTADGTAQAGSDYTATNGTLTFNPGESSKTFTVSLLDDNLYEGDETFNLNLSNPTGGAVLGTQTSASLNILDNDLKISINDLQVIEGINPTAKLTVSLNQSSSIPVKVDYITADDTAIALSDYTSTTGTLTFKPGETSKTITIPIVNDNISESIEQFFVNLSNPLNASINDNQGIVTVSDTLESAATKTLPNSVENLTLTGSYNINGSGNASDNLIIGNSGNNTLNGSTGIDTLIGGVGNDTYLVDNIADVVTETSTLATEIDTVKASLSYTLGDHVEKLILTGTASIDGTGNDLNNYLIGNSANNILNGLAGADTLKGGKGNDTYFVDNIADVVTETSTLATEIDTVKASLSYTLTANVENLTLTGTDNLNATGNSSNNLIIGNSGNNTLNGSTGIDTLIGGVGNDTYLVDNIADVVTETSMLATEIDTVKASLSYTLGDHVENLILTGTASIDGTGNDLNNYLIGNSANNILNGLAGADTLKGGEGKDTYFVDNIADVVTETSTLATEIDTVKASLSYTLTANVENLILTGTASIDGTGNDLNNYLIGNSANNILNGLAGADTLKGGEGNDTYFVDNIADVVTETSTLATEIDTVTASVNYTLTANVENLTLTGTDNLNATGNSSNNLIIGNSGNNILTGLAGSDTLIGGVGNDTYRFLVNANLGADSITETGGIDTLDFSGTTSPVRVNLGITTTQTVVTSKLSLILSANNAIENAIGGNGNDRLIGNALDNNLTGGAGNDQLIGGTGNDSFIFSTGKPYATADLGVDTLLDFTSGSDKISLSKTTFTALTGDSLTEFATVEDDSLVGDSAALIVYSESSSSLYYNQNGAIAGLGSGSEFAFIGSLASLMANDFTLIT